MRRQDHFDVPIPVKNVQDKWREVQLRRRAEVRFSPIDESHTRIDVSAEDEDFAHVMEELRRAGLAGRGAAGNPATLGAAPGAAGGTFPGGTGGTPAPGGGKPGTTT